MKEQIKAPEKNTTKQWRDSQPIRRTVQNTGNRDAHRIGWIWSQIRWQNDVMKGKDLHPRLLYPAKLSCRIEGQIKCFPDKVKLKEFIITKSLLYEMLSKKKRK